MDKFNIVPFIGKAVNVTMQQTRKWSWLNAIVIDGYLCIKDLTVEVLHEMLIPNDGLTLCSD